LARAIQHAEALGVDPFAEPGCQVQNLCGLPADE
jgi:hypothetical protein